MGLDRSIAPPRNAPLGRAVQFAGLRFDDADRARVLAWLDARSAADPFAYVVTPNADHVVRLHDYPDWEEVHEAYLDAQICLCDSKVLSMLAWLRGIALPALPGSDLIDSFVRQRIAPGRRIVLIGGSAETPALLARIMPGVEIIQHRPPMGLLGNAAAMRDCVDFIAAHPSDYTLLAVGSPQQEIIAWGASRHPDARGTGLCVGAAIDFLTGKEARAPRWMRALALEWLYRLLSNPRRLWRRYLLHSPKVFWIALKR